jgi:SulP family sulfate permease
VGLETVTLEGRYGALPTGLPLPRLPAVSMTLVLDLLPSAAAIALLAGVESLLSAMVADGMSKREGRHDPDAELRGQGLGNIASALLGGVPSTAAIARTGANIRNGADSRLAGVFHALTVLALMVALGPLTGGVPLAALAAVLVVVAWNIADAPEVAKLVRTAPRADAAVLIATLLITLTFDLTYAIGLGVIASLVLLVRNLLRVPAAAELVPDETGHIRPVSHALSERIRSRPDIAFFNATGVISFHCAEAVERELRGDARPLVVRMRDVAHVDASGLATLEGIIERRQRAG